MALSTEESGRLAALLSGQDERVTTRWTEIVTRSLRGRLSQAELRRQVQDLHHAIVVTGDKGTIDLSAESAGELRAALSELSRGRARQGFSATETTISVFALKDVLAELVQEAGGPNALQDYVAFSKLVDEMGLFTFELRPHPGEPDR